MGRAGHDTGHEARLDELLAAMTLAEKAALTAGDDTWHTPAVEHLGIGRMRMSDGPSGVRSVRPGGGRSLWFPCGMAAGATWDTELITRYGHALAGEAEDKGVHVLLGPTIGIPRTPLGGRTFESFSEDPHLSARLTVAYVRALQEHRVIGCAKHYACNDQEHERHTIDAIVDEVPMREIHLAPFEAAVREAHVGSVMAAYNRVGGTFASEHPWLLSEVLRDEWGFDGFVVSDWLATHSTAAAALAGLDVEMPGPGAFFGEHLAAAVETGTVPEAVVEEMARRSLRARARVGLLDPSPPARRGDHDDPQRRAVAHEIAVGATVLLRNDGVLPIDPGVGRVAVIGPNGAVLEPGGGGSSQVTPHRTLSFVDELRRLLPNAEITYDAGCDISRGMPGWDPRCVSGQMTIAFHNAGHPGEEPLSEVPVYDRAFTALGSPVAGTRLDELTATMRAEIRPPVGGRWQIGLSAVGDAQLRLDGAPVVDSHAAPPDPDSFYGFGRAAQMATVELEAGTTYNLTVEATPDSPVLWGVELGLSPEQPAGLLERAVAAARAADVAIVVVGSNRRWEREGSDRADLQLPGEQDELIRRVSAANPRTIVVLNTGSPVDITATGGAAALLTVWYPGEQGAAALAEVVTGRADPGGRLPITFPRSLADTPAAGSAQAYPGADGQVVYSEGLLVGYRHYDTNRVEPAFCFGHGLSYATFDYADPVLHAAEDGVGATVELEVRNTSERSGSDVVQLYVHRPGDTAGRPDQELQAFAKVHLDSGESATVRLQLDARAFARWDPATHEWRVPAGDTELRIGSSSRAIHHRLAHRTAAISLPA